MMFPGEGQPVDDGGEEAGWLKVSVKPEELSLLAIATALVSPSVSQFHFVSAEPGSGSAVPLGHHTGRWLPNATLLGTALLGVFESRKVRAV